MPFCQPGHFFQQFRLGRSAVQVDDAGKSTHVGDPPSLSLFNNDHFMTSY
jgi:hypothetical protein